MSAQALERLLAGLYSDRALLGRFLAAPLATSAQFGLDRGEARALAAVDAKEIEYAASRFDQVRAFRGRAAGPPAPRARLSRVERLAGVVREMLAEHGIAHVRGRISRKTFFAVAERLGTVWNEYFVYPDPRGTAYVRSHAQVPFHTDSARANLVAWHCTRACSSSVKNRYLDARHAFLQLGDAHKAHIAATRCRDRLQTRDFAGKGPWLPVADLRHGDARLFWLGHVVEKPRNRAQATALAKFGALVSGGKGARTVSLRLRKGEFVFIDNNRFLHGRDAIPADSPRLLYRLWINTDGWREARARRVRAPQPVPAKSRRA